MIGSEIGQRAWQSFHTLKRTLWDIGAKEALDKACPPNSVINCLGTLVNTQNMTLQVLPEIMLEIMQLLECWRHKVYTSRGQLESLIGKLQYISACVRMSRMFISHLLNLLRTMQRGKWYKIPQETRNDVLWWYVYLLKYNGISIQWLENWAEVDSLIATEACGVECEHTYFAQQFPDWLLAKTSNTAHLEMMAIIVGLKVCRDEITGRRFRISGDNIACVELINTGRARD